MADQDVMGTLDPRGVLRGACTQCTCCPSYGAEVEGAMSMKCRCGHPPGRHLKVPGSSSESVPMEVDPPSADNLLKPTHYKQEEQLNLPKCEVDECAERVHLNPHLPEGMQVFKYCSSQCRDKMLEKDKEKLQSDIKSMEQIMKSLKTAPISPSNHKQSNFPSKNLGANQPGTTPSGSSGTEPGPSNGSSASTGSSESKVLRQVKIKKKGREDLGLLFSSNLYQKGSLCGMIITGVKRWSSIYKYFQDAQILLLDIVTRVDNSVVSKPAEIYPMIADNLEVTLDFMHIGLPPVSGILSHAERNDKWTHVFAVRCAEKKEVGITVYNSDVVRISGVTKDSVGRTSGLIFDDVIWMYTTIKGTLHSFQAGGAEEFKNAIDKQLKLLVEQCESYILLFVQRSEQCTCVYCV